MRISCSTSARCGTFSSVSVSSVSSEAIISGSAAFLAPEIGMRAVELVAADNSDAIHEKSLSRLIRRLSCQADRLDHRTEPVQGTALRDRRLAQSPRPACPAAVAVSLLVFAGSPAAGSPSGLLVGAAGAPRPRLRLAALQVGAQFLGQPRLAVRLLRLCRSRRPLEFIVVRPDPPRQAGACASGGCTLWPCRGGRSSRAIWHALHALRCPDPCGRSPPRRQAAVAQW